MAVVVEQMRDKLLTLEDVHEKLKVTEPLSEDFISGDSKIAFRLTPGWEADLDAVDDTAQVDAFMKINGTERPMTKAAALQAGANFGLPAAYVRKAPAALIEQHLNYWYSGGMGDSAYNVLNVGDNVAAFTRPTLQPFSNLSLLEQVLEGIYGRYGSGTEILADYKIQNSLMQTDIRLIIPEHQRTIVGSGMSDIGQGSSDLWSTGIHLSNSLMGKKQTSVEAYLFRWWCTNGATTTMDEVGSWSRRVGGQDEMDVYNWARESVDEILSGMESKFDTIQALTALDVTGNTADIVRQIFTDYSVPVSQRQQVTDTLLESHTLTMYTIMNAITQTANEEGLSASRADKLMRIGGAIPTSTFDTLKAQVWREGHAADPQSPNPYEPTVLVIGE